jgi:hypothetical protein
MSATPLTRTRVDDLAKAIAVSRHVPVECHVKYRPSGGPDSVRLELSALKQHGYDLVVVVDECPTGSQVHEGAKDRLDAYCAHFGADAAAVVNPNGTLLELLLECVKSFVSKSAPISSAAPAVVHFSKPLLF